MAPATNAVVLSHRCGCFLFLLSLSLLLPAAAGGHRRVLAVRGRTSSKGIDGSPSALRYAVIFDAGSTGSRVHVYCFDDDLQLQRVGSSIELSLKIRPGLSGHAGDPRAAAASLAPLLEEAESTVPEELRPTTPVRVGATAGLRLLGKEKANQILEAVRHLLRENSSLEYEADWVTVLSGYQEGYYIWVTINYLLGNLGKWYSETAAVIDLGGASVQMAYAISEEAASFAPNASSKEESYVEELFLNRTKYYLYVHSYLNYGLMAARAEILKAGSAKSCSYCILGGYSGVYAYGGEMLNASSSPSGASLRKCRREVIKALRIDAPCSHPKCSFGGVWNGGGGAGRITQYAVSNFFGRASQVGLIDRDATSAAAKPLGFMKAAEIACKATMDDVGEKYPELHESDRPYICMDLVYQYTLLVDGFGLEPQQDTVVARKVKYGDSAEYGDAAWPLGSAIEVVTSENTIFKG